MNDLSRPDPRSIDFQAAVTGALRDVSAYQGQGAMPVFLPALAEVDPRKLGMAVVTGDGACYQAGDAEETFSIQSIANVFTLALVLQHVGGALWNHVGREASGSPVNAIVQLELSKGKPRNPLINAGALVVADKLIARDNAEVAIEELLYFLRERCGEESITFDEDVAISESRGGSLNRSLAYFIAAFNNITNTPEEVVSVYFRQCAIAMNCCQLARAALFLAFDGMDPVSGEKIIKPSHCRSVLALMMTCGHYDNSGDFAFRIGLPGKSGVSGGILAIAPGRGAAAVWSPGLNGAGTSLAGSAALERLVEYTGWSVFA